MGAGIGERPPSRNGRSGQFNEVLRYNDAARRSGGRVTCRPLDILAALALFLVHVAGKASPCLWIAGNLCSADIGNKVLASRVVTEVISPLVMGDGQTGRSGASVGAGSAGIDAGIKATL